jgi:hypothetical protein
MTRLELWGGDGIGQTVVMLPYYRFRRSECIHAENSVLFRVADIMRVAYPH